MFGNADSTIILSAEERIVIISSGIFVKILCVGFTMNYIRKIESLDIQGSLFLRWDAREVVPYDWRNNVILVGVDVLGAPFLMWRYAREVVPYNNTPHPKSPTPSIFFALTHFFLL